MSLQTRYQLTRHFDGPDDGTTMAFVMLPRGAELRPWDATGIGCPAQESPDA